MKYQFQSASHIDDYLKAIAGSDEFIVKTDNKNGLLVINYLFTTPITFPDPAGLEGEAHRLAVLRRDCRGLKFDLETGDVVAKPYHKFFNVNQVAETQVGVIDWSRPHVILEKLDGSMITPFWHKDGAFQWHTKMGPTDVATPIHERLQHLPTYVRLCEAMKEDGCTPIFEWCSRVQRIVIDYPRDQFVLTAVRHNTTGHYMAYPALVELAQRFRVPLVLALPGTVQNAQSFLDETAEIENAEGFVVRFDDGHMCKIKGAWYCRIHNTKEILVFEKNVWNLILNDSVDDAMAFMDDRDKPLVEDFAAEFEKRVRRRANDLADRVTQARQTVENKKQFALEVAPTYPKRERSLMFSIWDGGNPVDVVKEFLAKNVGTQRAVDEVRDFIDGLAWKDFYYPTELDD